MPNYCFNSTALNISVEKNFMLKINPFRKQIDTKIN